MRIFIILFTLLFTLTLYAQDKRFLESNEVIIGKPGVGDPAGEIRFRNTTQKIRGNKTTGKLEFTNDGSIFKKLGSGSGGGSAGINEFSEQDKNPNAEDGITGWTTLSTTLTVVSTATAKIEGDQSFRVDFDAQNDYVQSPVVSAAKDYLYGQGCEMSFTYYGFDDKVAIQVRNNDGDILGETDLTASNGQGRESVFFLCPTAAAISGDADKGQLFFRIYAKDSGDPAVGTFDLVYFGLLSSLAETTLPDVFSAEISSTGVVSGESVDWINGNCSVALTSQYTCNFNPGVFSIAPTCVATGVNNVNNILALEFTPATTSSVVWYTNRADTSAAVASAFKVVCKKAGADAKQSVQVYKNIPRVAQNINEFSAKVSIASPGVVSGENVDWINGNCTRSGTNNYIATCTFAPGIFTVAPNCTATISSTFDNRGIRVNPTATEVVVRTYDGGLFESNDFNVICQKAGVDYKTPVVQPILFPQGTEYTSVVSSVKTPVASGHYMAMTGNSIVVPTGQEWEINGTITFLNSGGSPGYTSYYVDFFAANGADSASQPANITPLSGLATVQVEALSTQTILRVTTGTIRVSSGTYYLVPFAGMSTPANARVTAYINGKRVK